MIISNLAYIKLYFSFCDYIFLSLKRPFFHKFVIQKKTKYFRSFNIWMRSKTVIKPDTSIKLIKYLTIKIHNRDKTLTKRIVVESIWSTLCKVMYWWNRQKLLLELLNDSHHSVTSSTFISSTSSSTYVCNYWKFLTHFCTAPSIAVIGNF